MKIILCAAVLSVVCAAQGWAFVDENVSPHITYAQQKNQAIDNGKDDVTTTGSVSSAPKIAGKARYQDLVAKHARAQGVPVALAKAVVHVESRYNPRATGRVGEVGLMQLKLQTARGMGYTGSRANLYDPETNIRYGMKYLAKAHQLAGGDLCGTILRYNAGHYAKRMSAGPRRYCNKVKALIGA